MRWKAERPLNNIGEEQRLPRGAGRLRKVHGACREEQPRIIVKLVLLVGALSSNIPSQRICSSAQRQKTTFDDGPNHEQGRPA